MFIKVAYIQCCGRLSSHRRTQHERGRLRFSLATTATTTAAAMHSSSCSSSFFILLSVTWNTRDIYMNINYVAEIQCTSISNEQLVSVDMYPSTYMYPDTSCSSGIHVSGRHVSRCKRGFRHSSLQCLIYRKVNRIFVYYTAIQLFIKRIWWWWLRLWLWLWLFLFLVCCK